MTPDNQKVDSYRELARRQHRMLAAYAAFKAWQLGVECVRVNSENLKQFLGNKRFSEDRIIWLKNDVAPWFPHVTPYYHKYEIESSSLAGVAFSRVVFDEALVQSPKAVELPLPKRGLTEAALTSFLHNLSVGVSEEES